MKKLLSILVLIVLMSFSIGTVSAKEYKELRIGVEGAYPPFSSVSPDGTLVGFDIDIAKALCKQMGVKYVLIAQDWDGIIPGLLARKYDAIIASVSITKERKKKVAFSNKYYQTPAKFICKKNTIKEISKDTIRGKKVGVQRATTHDKYLTDNYKDDVKIKRYGTLDEACLDLTAKRIDMILADSVALMDVFLNKPAGANYEFIGPDLTDVKWFGEGIGIVFRKHNKNLIKKFNKAIDDIRANGVYRAIQDKYFNFNVFGN